MYSYMIILSRCLHYESGQYFHIILKLIWYILLFVELHLVFGSKNLWPLRQNLTLGMCGDPADYPTPWIIKFFHFLLSIFYHGPRRAYVAQFRLSTGHDCLGKHLHHFGIMLTSACMLCNSNDDMDRQHLQSCPAFLSPTKEMRYWETRFKMMSLMCSIYPAIWLYK